jgi:hypothetical protein
LEPRRRLCPRPFTKRGFAEAGDAIQASGCMGWIIAPGSLHRLPAAFEQFVVLHAGQRPIQCPVPGRAVLVDVFHVLGKSVAVPLVDATNTQLHSRRENVGLEREECFACTPHVNSIA